MKIWKTGLIAIALIGLLSTFQGSGAIAGDNAGSVKGVFKTADIVLPTNHSGKAPPVGLVKFADLRPETKYTVETVQYGYPRRSYYRPYQYYTYPSYTYRPYYSSYYAPVYPYYTYRPRYGYYANPYRSYYAGPRWYW